MRVTLSTSLLLVSDFNGAPDSSEGKGASKNRWCKQSRYGVNLVPPTFGTTLSTGLLSFKKVAYHPMVIMDN